MEETLIYHFNSESNRQSPEWTAAGDSRPKWPKTQTSTGKVLAYVFWDAQGILFIYYLEKGRIINSIYYIALLVRLKEEIAKKRPQMKKKVLFQQDNSPCHKSMAKLYELHFELLLHPSYSLDLTPVATGCLQTSKECFSERDWDSMKKWYRKLSGFLRPKTNRSTNKASNC